MRRLAAGIAAVATISLLLVGPAPAASAKVPPPPKALAAATIDAHLGYMPQSTCTPKAKPGTTAVLKLLIATWGGSSSGISRGCGVGTTSEHKEGRALDWRMNVKSASQRKRVDKAVAWLTANNGEVAYRLGVMYVIWNQRIWSLYYPELGWRKMANRGSVHRQPQEPRAHLAVLGRRDEADVVVDRRPGDPAAELPLRGERRPGLPSDDRTRPAPGRC